MSFILRPIALTPAQIVSNFSRGDGANLTDPQPKVTAGNSGYSFAWTTSILLDLGADTVIDTLAVLFHTGNSAGTWLASTRTAAAGPFPGLGDFTGGTILFASPPWRTDPTIATGRFHALWAGAQRTARYVQIALNSPDASNPNFEAGVLAIGRRFEPQNAGAGPGVDLGGGRALRDLSEVRELDGGELSVWRRARVPEIRFSWSQLTDAESRELWALLSAAGTSQPVLFVEDAAATPGQQERIHYGLLRDIEVLQRTQSDKSRWSATVRGWL